MALYWTPYNPSRRPDPFGIADIKVLQAILDSGEVRGAKIGMWPALFVAVFNNSPQMAEALIQKGADAGERDITGETALHRAALLGFDAVAEALLKNGAPIDTLNKLGFTPLMLAALSGYKEVVKLLLEYGTDLSVPDADGDNIIDWLEWKWKGRVDSHGFVDKTVRNKIRRMIMDVKYNRS